MEAKDLMIGDWILGLVEDNEQVGKVIAKHPARVTEINQNGDFSAECPYAFDELFDGDGHRIDDFLWYDTEPIPLTAEILKKNGFDCFDKEIARLYFEDGDYKEHFTLRAMYEKETGTQKGWAFFAFNILVVLDYVHELQHALRLCGIDKTIEL